MDKDDVVNKFIFVSGGKSFSGIPMGTKTLKIKRKSRWTMSQNSMYNHIYKSQSERIELNGRVVLGK